MPPVKVVVGPQSHLKVNAKHGPRDSQVPQTIPPPSPAKVDACLKIISRSCCLIGGLLGLSTDPSKFALWCIDECKSTAAHSQISLI